MTVGNPVVATNTKNFPIKCGPYLMMPRIPSRVPLEFVSMFGYDNFVYDFSFLQEQLLTHTDDGRPLIDWRSPLSSIDGYGRHAIWLIRGLQRAGVELNVHDVGWIDNAWLPPDIQQMRSQANGVLPAKVNLSFTLGYDPHLYEHSSLIKLGITQFETDTLPTRHVENVNKLDHVIVTSSFQTKVFKRCGVTTPISVMTPGVEVSEFPYVERRMDGLFKVLLLGALTPRKNPLGAIRIFQAASKGNPDWRLTLKSRPGAEMFEEAHRAAKSDSRIDVVIVDDHPDALMEYYKTHHCMLWPSLAEGVGLPPLEAMSTGMEVVCSDNSGMSDYVSEDICYPIKMKGMESAHGPGVFSDAYVRFHGQVGSWWSPSEAHGAKQLERCFNNWRSGKGKGHRAAQVIRERFTIDHSVASILPVIVQYTS